MKPSNVKIERLKSFSARTLGPSLELIDDIRRNGIKIPIKIRGRNIIDGVLRVEACKVLGIKKIKAVRLR